MFITQIAFLISETNYNTNMLNYKLQFDKVWIKCCFIKLVTFTKQRRKYQREEWKRIVRREDIPSDGHLPAPKITPLNLASTLSSPSSYTACPGMVMVVPMIVERPVHNYNWVRYYKSPRTRSCQQNKAIAG